MWVCLNNSFLSIVHKDCEPSELLVRARVAGHIEAVFPNAVVNRTVGNDYLFRAVVSRIDVASALTSLVMNNFYNNFKNSVFDDRLHNAYSNVWGTMSRLQEVPPYGFTNWFNPITSDDDVDDDIDMLDDSVGFDNDASPEREEVFNAKVVSVVTS